MHYHGATDAIHMAGQGVEVGSRTEMLQFSAFRLPMCRLPSLLIIRL